MFLPGHDRGTAEKWLQTAGLCRFAGDIQGEVESLEQAALCSPRPREIYVELGNLLASIRRLDEAVRAYRNALAADVSDPVALSGLADALHRVGRSDEAAETYRTLVRVAPQSAEVLNNLGNFLSETGRLQEAIDALTAAAKLRPDLAEIHNNLGVALKKADRLQPAIDCYRRAISIQPLFPEAHNNLANAFTKAQEYDAAFRHFTEALTQRPDYVDASFNYGNALAQIGLLVEAAAAFRRAVEFRPDHADALVGLANALRGRGCSVKAAEYYERALRIEPQSFEAHLNFGSLMIQRGQLDNALARLREAERLRPDHGGVQSCLGMVAMDQGRLETARHHFERALALSNDDPNAASNLLLCLEHCPEPSRQELFEQHVRLGRLFAAAEPPMHKIEVTPNRRLRIGYVSPDFRSHVVMRFVEPILKSHDTARFEVFAYSESSIVDDATRRLQSVVANWRSIHGRSDAAVARQIRDDRIDVLVDLAGHTSQHRLGVFALRPAPIQATYLGYPDTTGAPGIDIRLTDAIVDPAGAEAFATESLVRLPRGFCCLEPPTPAPPIQMRTSGFAFGSAHRLSRLNAQVLDAWCEILRRAPESRLIVFRNTLTGTTRERFRREFTDRGIAEDRVDLRSDFSADRSHLEIYHEIDVLLDTFPWSGHATACESLWMGVPPLTLLGDRPAGRMVGSVLHRLDLTEFIAASVAEYISQGVALAAAPRQVRSLRPTLRERLRSGLCDSVAFTRDLEAVLQSLWQAFLKRSPSGGR